LIRRSDQRKGDIIMGTIPSKCMDVNAVGSFCNCVSDAEDVDAAVGAFCERAKTESGKNLTGKDLAELKKAVSDMESDCGCGCC
jgi:hypothetical protein